MNNISKKIKFILANEKLSEYQLSKITGIARSTIYNLANGDTKKISSVVAKKICDHFPNYPFDYLTNDSIDYGIIKPEVKKESLEDIITARVMDRFKVKLQALEDLQELNNELMEINERIEKLEDSEVKRKLLKKLS